MPTPIGWDERYIDCPDILREVKRAAAPLSRFVHLYRGDFRVPLYPEYFWLTGLKSLPAYSANGTADIILPRHLAENESEFERIAVAFAKTRMAHERCRGITAIEIVTEWRGLVRSSRFYLAQALLEALQYQNNRPSVRELRTEIPILSFTRDPEVALKYALHQKPDEAFVFEYAPPIDEGLFRDVADLATDFKDQRLGDVFRDRDSEVFVWYAALPHYILGYSRLEQIGSGRYSCRFHPNQYFFNGVTLENPPELTENQQRMMTKTREELKWFEHEDGWQQMIGSDGRKRLNPPI